jgi:hypothetical protein
MDVPIGNQTGALGAGNLGLSAAEVFSWHSRAHSSIMLRSNPQPAIERADQEYRPRRAKRSKNDVVGGALAQAHHLALRFLVAFSDGVISDLAVAVIFSLDFRLARSASIGLMTLLLASSRRRWAALQRLGWS